MAVEIVGRALAVALEEAGDGPRGLGEPLDRAAEERLAAERPAGRVVGIGGRGILDEIGGRHDLVAAADGDGDAFAAGPAVLCDELFGARPVAVRVHEFHGDVGRLRGVFPQQRFRGAAGFVVRPQQRDEPDVLRDGFQLPPAGVGQPRERPAAPVEALVMASREDVGQGEDRDAQSDGRGDVGAQQPAPGPVGEVEDGGVVGHGVSASGAPPGCGRP